MGPVVLSTRTRCLFQKPSLPLTLFVCSRIFFSALAQGLSHFSLPVATQEVWNDALKSALERLYTYTRARPPSRTLIDPLAAFIDTFPAGFSVAAKAANEAAERTRELEAKAGRSAYVESGRLIAEKTPDPGAWGVKVLIDALGAN